MYGFEDPEQSYRRGYYHGAHSLFDAVKHHLPDSAANDIDKWLWKVWEWRLREDASWGNPERPITYDIAPPEPGKF